MGDIAAAAFVAHIPTLVVPEEIRRQWGDGQDTTLAAGLDRVREHLDAVGGIDTLVIIDTHWFTTTEHVFAGAEHFEGVYTSEEMPRAISDKPYDYPGAPELAKVLHETAKEAGVRTTNATSPALPVHYPTLILLDYLHRGEGVLSIGICQTAQRDDFLAFGKVLGEAIRRSGSRAAILAAGGMSHRFYPLGEILDHLSYDPFHIITPEARGMDEKIIGLWERGDHAAVIDMYPEFRKHSPEGFFGHYLIMAGALGGREWTAPGTKLSDYENSVGTGQVHVWFDLSAS